MTMNNHDKIRGLLALRTDDLSSEERLLLQEHLPACATCRHYAESARQVLEAMRSAPLERDEWLLRSIQRQVRERALQLQQRRTQRWLVILLGVFVIASTALGGFVFWEVLRWAGASGWAWPTGVELFWTGPVLFAAVVLAARDIQFQPLTQRSVN